MTNAPHISVLMSAYNVGDYVAEAIESLATQTYQDFELLVYDDGSSDHTRQALQRCASNDGRIRLFHSDSNIGVAKAVNLLFDQSRGALVARMDADDICHPQRFEHQVRSLQDGQCDLVGAWMTVFGDGPQRLLRYPTDDAGIKAGLLFTSMFSQPTVMMRRETFAAVRYSSESGILEDYDFWVRQALHGTRMLNLPMSLLRHRRHSAQTSSRLHGEQWRIAAQVSLRYLAALGMTATPEEQSVHVGVRSPQPPRSMQDIRDTDAWLQKLVRHYTGSPSAQKVVAEHWYRYCLKASVLGLGAYRAFVASPLQEHLDRRTWDHLALLGLGLTRLGPESRLRPYLQSLNPLARIRRRD